MGGGFVAKEKLVSSGNGAPCNFFILNDNKINVDWISGGSIPAYKSTLDFLKLNNIGMIVSLTIEKLKVGRNINHIPFDHKDSTAWLDSDLEESDLKDFIIEHIPIADTYYPTPENCEKLIQIVKDYRISNPTKKIYFHCWAGKGRTCTVVMYILMKLYDLSFNDATFLVGKNYSGCSTKDAQYRFLKGGYSLEGDIVDIQPIIKTPKDHSCYLPLLKEKLFDDEDIFS